MAQEIDHIEIEPMEVAIRETLHTWRKAGNNSVSIYLTNPLKEKRRASAEAVAEKLRHEGLEAFIAETEETSYDATILTVFKLYQLSA